MKWKREPVIIGFLSFVRCVEWLLIFFECIWLCC